MLVETEELAEVLSLADKVSDKDSTGLASVDDKVVAASSLKTASPPSSVYAEEEQAHEKVIDTRDVLATRGEAVLSEEAATCSSSA